MQAYFGAVKGTFRAENKARFPRMAFFVLNGFGVLVLFKERKCLVKISTEMGSAAENRIGLALFMFVPALFIILSGALDFCAHGDM